MSEFNGRQFYGYSMCKDPHLATTTKNFEFKYARPEILEKVIEEVHDSNRTKSNKKNLNWHNNWHLKYQTSQGECGVDIPELKRDVDVETQMSQEVQPSYKKVRTLTDDEVDNLIEKTKCKTVETLYSKKLANSRIEPSSIYSKGKKPTKSDFLKEESFSQIENYKYHGLENSSSTTSSVESSSISERHGHVTPTICKATVEEITKPQAQLIEVIEPQPKESLIEITETKEKVERLKTDIPSAPSKNFDYFNMPLQNYNTACLPAMLMNDMVLDNMRLACDYNCSPYVESPVDGYIVEDSDLEFELRTRPNYTKYCKSRPKTDELRTESFDETQGPTFVEIESNVNESNVCYIRNASPIHFTEITDDTPNEPTEFKVELGAKNVSNEYEVISPCTTDRFKESPLKKSPIKRKQRLNGGRDIQCSRPPTSIPANTYSNLSNGTNETARTAKTTTTKETHTTTSTSTKTNQSMYENAKTTTKRKPKCSLNKNIHVSKSIEDLKIQKTNIFSKMTGTQERIIEILDQLRLNLVELNIPESPYDKSKRQKNAFEFSVRFSRNFLYPLRSMVNDLKCTPNEQFTSLTSNDACARVCHIYGLFMQSLQAFQKQLRYFLLDQVPQKLTALIELIYNTTNICLEKNIFSDQDMIVDCLQQRVVKFIGFMEDMHEGRLEAVRQNHRKLTLSRASTKYDLKMFMNDLNMYEPKLVRKTKETASKKKNKTKKVTYVTPVPEKKNSKETIKEKPAEDMIATQIEGLARANSSILSFVNKTSCATVQNSKDVAIPLSNVEMVSADGEELDKRVIEALQNITKEQVRQILDPLFSNLEMALNNQNNSKIIEDLVSAFNNKVFTALEMEAQKLANKYHASSSSSSTIKNSNNNSSNIYLNLNEISQITLHDNDCDNSNNGNDNNTFNGNNAKNVDSTEKSISNSLEIARTTELSEQQNIDCCLMQQQPIAEVNGVGDTLNIINKSNNNNTNNNNNVNANHINKQKLNENVNTNDNGNKNITENENENLDENQQNIRHNGSVGVGVGAGDGDGDGYSVKTQKDNIGKNIPASAFHKYNNRGMKIKLTPTSCDNEISLSCIEADAELNLSSAEDSFVMNNNNKKRVKKDIAKNQLKQSDNNKRHNRKDRVIPEELSKRTSISTSTTNGSVFKNKHTSSKKSLSTENVTPISQHNLMSKKLQQQQQHNNNNHNNIQKQVQRNNSAKTKYSAKKKGNVTNSPPTPPVSPVSFTNSQQLIQDSHKTKTKRSVHNTEKETSRLSESKYSTTTKDTKNDLNNLPTATIVESPTGMRYVELYHNLLYDISKEAMNVASVKASKETSESERGIQGGKTAEMEVATAATSKKTVLTNADVNEMLKHRNDFIKLCSKNRFYHNPNFDQPWTTFSIISEQLVNDVLGAVEEDFAKGVSQFVEDFLELETKCYL